jgi:hypothetical protein
MSIFSRLFQKEEGGPETPLDAAAVGSVPATEKRPAVPAAQPEALLGAMADKTTPMVVIEAPPPPPPPTRSDRRAAAERTLVGTPPPAPDLDLPRTAPRLPPPNGSDRPREAVQSPVPPPTPPQRRSAPARKGTTPDGVVDAALNRLFPTEPGARPATPRDGVSTAHDQAAVRATFEDLAVGHVRPLRNMMIELRFADGLAGWELARAALKSLRKMAEPLEMTALCQALDGFAAALDAETRAGALGADARERLMAAYQPLCTALPRAFVLDGERDRREPLLVPALLRQVPGLEPLMIHRLGAVGLARLETLMRATAEEIAVVAQIPPAVAAALAAKMQELRNAGEAAMGLDSPAARRALQAEVRAFEAVCQAFEKAAAAWSAESRAAKVRHRRQRELVFLRIVVALARAGEVDLARRLETLPSGHRIAELDRCLREAAAAPQI